MGKKEDRLLIGLFIVISVSIMIWCLMGKSKCDKQKDEYAKNNNHDLLRIKYDAKDVEKRLMDYISEHYDLNIDE